LSDKMSETAYEDYFPDLQLFVWSGSFNECTEVFIDFKG